MTLVERIFRLLTYKSKVPAALLACILPPERFEEMVYDRQPKENYMRYIEFSLLGLYIERTW